MPYCTTAVSPRITRDVVDIHAQFVRRNLREGGLLTLAVMADSGQHGHFARRFDLHRRTLPSTGGRGRRRPNAANLAVGADADTHQLALLARFGLLGAQLFIIHGGQSFFEWRRVIARVIHQPGSGREWKLLTLDEISNANLGGVHLELVGQNIHHALDAVGGFWPPGAAIRIGGNAIGERADDVGTYVLSSIEARHHEHAQRGNRRRQQLVIRAQILD